MGEVNQFKWVGIRPTEPAETIPVSDRRLQHFYASAVDVTVAAGGTYDVLSASGAGCLTGIIHKSVGIPAGNAYFLCKLDNNFFNIFLAKTDISWTYAMGMTSEGRYQLGSSAIWVRSWDTTNHEYWIHQYCAQIPFANSIYMYLKNTNATTDATMRGQVSYHMYTSSRVISLTAKHAVSKHVEEVKRMIDKDYKKCEAVIWQIESDFDELEQVKEKNIPKLHIVVDDDAFERLKDKIINRLVKENLI